MPAAAPAAPDAVPGVISYQGTLTDAAGKPVSGNVNVTFRLYSVPSGGTALWTEAHTESNAVLVNNGLFNVLLGSLTPISTTVWSNSPLYLGVQVGSDLEMSPREVVGAVPAAMTVPDGSITGAKIANGAVTQAKTDSLVAAPWPNRTVVVLTYVGTTDANGMLSIDIAGYGFTYIDGVVASNGDDGAEQNCLVNVYDWSASQVRVRVWNNGALATGRLIRINLAIMGIR